MLLGRLTGRQELVHSAGPVVVGPDSGWSKGEITAAGGTFSPSTRTMARRRVSPRRLAFAALLVGLAVLPNVVHVRGGLTYGWPNPEQPSFLVYVVNHHWFSVDATSADRARGIAYRWDRYRFYSWIPAVVAACVLVWPFLPIRAIFGPDDEEH